MTSENEGTTSEVALQLHDRIVDLDKLLNKVMAIIIEVTHADIGAVFARDGDSLVATRGHDRKGKYDRHTIAKQSVSFVTKAVKDRETLLKTGDGQSALCVPLVIGEEPIGAVYVHSESRGDGFSDEEVEALEQLSGHIAVAIHNAHLYRSAITDAMTGLYNSTYMSQRLRQEVSRAVRYGQLFSFVLIDIDNFRQLNKKEGRGVGDKMLKKVAGVISGNVRESDLAFRYGGDEFAVILLNADRDMAGVCVGRMRKELEEATSGDERFGELGLSAGTAVCPYDAETALDLVEGADTDLRANRAKRKAK
jgi:diguanylate cyclase (GGDEF)-like protein